MSDRVIALALCWRIERRDGIAVALTDHDSDLVVNGVRYGAAPGMTPSAIARAEGLDADTMEASGALHADGITERDLRAGRWDGARVVVLAVDWSDADAAPVPVGEGRIGDVTLDGERFTAELRGVQARLEQPVTEATSPACRASLGDRRCRVAMAPRRRFARVVGVSGTRLTLDRSEPVDNAYAEGLVRWFGGDNAGLESAVAASQGADVLLRVQPPFAVAPGTLVDIAEGCDRRLATCATRFDNVANFRGEPFLPGIDLLTRYPGA